MKKTQEIELKISRHRAVIRQLGERLARLERVNVDALGVRAAQKHFDEEQEVVTALNAARSRIEALEQELAQAAGQDARIEKKTLENLIDDQLPVFNAAREQVERLAGELAGALQQYQQERQRMDSRLDRYLEFDRPLIAFERLDTGLPEQAASHLRAIAAVKI